jgi:aminoglycoside/choline kinase family phosphotransferase
MTEKISSIENLKSNLADFLKTDGFTLDPIEGGASVRKYFIIHFKENSRFPTRTVILMYIPQERIDIADNYHNISHYFSQMNVSQPRLYEVHRDLGWLFVEHAAGHRLDLYLQNSAAKEVPRIYHQLVDFLLDLQNRALVENDCWAFERYFDTEKYQFEFSFHLREQLLENYFQHRLSDTEQQVFAKATLEISEFLNNHLPVFVHRDFQSSNIFYHPTSSGNNFQIIDFQDARSGGPMYDLVSLLWDSYYSVSDDLQNELLQKFYQAQSLVKKNFSPDEYRQTVDYSVIQRKLHDAGAFVYSFHLTGNDRYLKYIHPAIRMAIRQMEPYSHMNQFKDLLLKTMAKSHA